MSYLVDYSLDVTKGLRMYEQLETDIIKLTGCNLMKLREMLSSGYTLSPPILEAKESKNIDT